MDKHDVSTGDIAAHAVTLTAGEQSIVEFADDCSTIAVIVLTATQPVYFTADGTPATIGGPNTHIIPPNSAREDVEPNTYGPTIVHLVSAAAATVSVERTA
jgi:hypothetical protein